MNILRTNSENLDFRKLISELDKLLTDRDKEAHSHCIQYNQLDKIGHVVVVYCEDVAVGCGAMKEYESQTIEFKRMFVNKSYRNQGIATSILLELEKWAKELGYSKVILETGYKLPEAMALYEKNSYKVIPNYDQYAHMESSVCYAKELTK